MHIIGHQKIINNLDRCLEKGVFGHAYLFSGPESVGKYKVAKHFAEKLVGNGKESGEILIVSPEVEEEKGVVKKRDIKIESVRAIPRHLSQTSFSGGAKAVVIDEADRMTVAAQNALLKTLEEPPPKSYIFLVASDSSKLLPTILSRVEIKKFSVIPDSQIDRFISSSDKKKELLFWAMGRPGVLLRLMEDEGELEKRKAAFGQLRKLTDFSTDERLALAEGWSKNIPQALENLSFWSYIIRSRYLGGLKEIPISREKAVKLELKIEKASADIHGTNASARMIMESLFLSI